LAYSLTLKTDPTYFSETSIDFSQTIHYVAEDRTFNVYLCFRGEPLKHFFYGNVTVTGRWSDENRRFHRTITVG
jgi:hypothetical protein